MWYLKGTLIFYRQSNRKTRREKLDNRLEYDVVSDAVAVELSEMQRDSIVKELKD